jgi:hypothetical protein
VVVDGISGMGMHGVKVWGGGRVRG